MQKMVEADSSSLPEFVGISQKELETYWELWTRWRATDRKFLPSQLMAEPSRPLDVLLELDGIYNIIEKQYMDKKSKENE